MPLDRMIANDLEAIRMLFSGGKGGRKSAPSTSENETQGE